jgi:hypothetical protein
MSIRCWSASVALTLATASVAQGAEHATLDLESGVASNGYNDIAIPGERGTRFSLTDDLQSTPGVYYRFQAAARLGEHHALRILYAPLTLAASGTLRQPVYFDQVSFPAETPLEARYQFNSYRLSYRYSLWRHGRNELALGFTGKIRDARVSVVGGGKAAEYSNVGFVPLLHLLGRWQLHSRWGAYLEIDALGAPQGRAEDVLLSVEYYPSPRVSLRAGYRMVEGGADNEKVYTFAWIHYAALAGTVHF